MKWVMLTVLTLLLASGCSPDAEQIDPSSGLALRSSADTVRFDTLLTSRGSTTQRLKIYNPNTTAIRIDEIALAGGDGSPYALVINGRPSFRLENEVILGGDSLQILVAVTIDPTDSNLPFLVEDRIRYRWNGNEETIYLKAYGQDAIFIDAGTICDEIWTAARPYVILGDLVVPEGCTWQVNAGARIYLDNDVALFINGQMHLNGMQAERITMRNSRLDEDFQQAPGQWEAIYLLEGSGPHQWSNVDISNGQIGVQADIPDDDTLTDLTIAGVRIQHMSVAGILAFSSDIKGVNIQLNNCGQVLLGNYLGGHYRYDHCTFSNEPNFFIRDEPSVQFSDNLIVNGEMTTAPLDVSIRNSILWDGQREALIFSTVATPEAIVLKKNLIRSTQEWPDNFTSNQPDAPGFLNAFQFDYRLDATSFARNKGLSLGVKSDLTGKLRDDGQPDLGAYEF